MTTPLDAAAVAQLCHLATEGLQDDRNSPDLKQVARGFLALAAQWTELQSALEAIASRLMHEEDCASVQPKRQQPKGGAKCDCWLVEVMPILDAVLTEGR